MKLAEANELQISIRDAIADVMRDRGRYPNVLLLHPSDFNLLHYACCRKSAMTNAENIYQDLRILMTLDVDPGKPEVY